MKSKRDSFRSKVIENGEKFCYREEIEEETYHFWRLEKVARDLIEKSGWRLRSEFWRALIREICRVECRCEIDGEERESDALQLRDWFTIMPLGRDSEWPPV
jgi:hypothetical protein